MNLNFTSELELNEDCWKKSLKFSDAISFMKECLERPFYDF